MSLGSLDVNLYGVVLAGVASVVVGMVYYHDSVFGKQWKKLAKIDEKRFQKEMPRMVPALFLGAMITAYLIGYVTCLFQAFWDVPWLQASMAATGILFAAVAVNMYLHSALDQRPTRLTGINLGNRLLSFLAMGLIVGWLHP